MKIDRMGSVDPLRKYNKTTQATKTTGKEKGDTISVSAEAKNRAELFRASEIAKSAPDIRMDRVEEVKRKLQDPSYIDEKVLESVADSIVDLFGL